MPIRDRRRPRTAWRQVETTCRPHRGKSCKVRLYLDDENFVRKVACSKIVELRLCSMLGNQCKYHAMYGRGQKPYPEAPAGA